MSLREALRRRRSTVSAGIVGAGAGLLLTGCGTGFGAQTQQVYDAGEGVNVRAGDVWALNALVVDNGDGSGTLSVSLLDKSGDGDELVGVKVTTVADEPIEVAQTPQPLVLCADQLAILGTTAAVTLEGDSFAAGYNVTLSMTFRDAEPVRVQVPVVERTDVYDSVAATPAESPQRPAPECGSASPTLG
ncbi:MAG: hypothetical protein M3Q17_11410 [Actinomycetota bacterium]|nr:hypothetical protein [Actinomycetota bacterium]